MTGRQEPIDCSVTFDTTKVRGKTAIITGGAQGIGEAYARALAHAGAHVVVGDIDSQRGEKLASELQEQVEFVKCDVTKWDDQVSLFRSAISWSPTGLIHAVVANAGVSLADEVFDTENANQEEPSEPSMKTLEINYKGVLYTTKLALHYFRKQHAAAAEQGNADSLETNLVLQGSIAGYLDTPMYCEYGSSKWAVRGLMRSLRGTTLTHGTRVNALCPSFIKTALLPRQLLDMLNANDIPCAEINDCGECLLRILCDSDIEGRALCVVAKNLVKQAPIGYYDLSADEGVDGPWMKMFH